MMPQGGAPVVLVLLRLSSCGIHAEESDLIWEIRIPTGAVCAALDDLCGRRMALDTKDAERRELHRAAMEVRNPVESEGATIHSSNREMAR